jgi:hypothetical protein
MELGYLDAVGNPWKFLSEQPAFPSVCRGISLCQRNYPPSKRAERQVGDHRVRDFSLGVLGHCLWNESHAWLFPIYAQDLMLILLPVSALLWLWREKHFAHKLAELMCRNRKVLHALNVAVAVLAVGVWHPERNVDLSYPRDWKSVEVEVSRGPCYGSCAVYTIKAGGEGQVEYVGRQRHSQKETRKSGMIEQEKIAELLKRLNRVEFTTLDGRAFRWAFDTPSIGVRVSVDGRTKVVVSDEYNEGPTRGRQARFLEAADEVDTILRSTIWTRCEGECGSSEANR